MKNNEIRKMLLRFGEKDNKAIWIKDELRTLFGKKTEATFNQALNALVADGTLQRLNRGVFYHPYHPHLESSKLVGQAVNALRRGHYNYLSLESALSDYGIISQVPFCLTFVTTGRNGLFETPIGTFEFTHTNRTDEEIVNSVYIHEDFWRATPQTALRDLRRVGRNLHLIDEDAAAEEIEYHAALKAKRQNSEALA